MTKYMKDTIENDADLVAAQHALGETDSEIELERLATMVERYIDHSHVIPKPSDQTPVFLRKKALAENGAFLESVFLFSEYFYECVFKKEDEARSIISQHIEIQGFSDKDSFEVIRDYFYKFYSRAALYHNWHHTCCMIVNVSEAYAHTINLEKKFWNLKEYKSLILAAAFHDIAHTGGHENDTINVGRAITMTTDFIKNRGLDSQIDLNLVISLIRVTEFPFVFEPKTELEKIIRDADLLQMLEQTWFPMIYQNLLAEIRVKRPSLTFAEFCKGQHDFLHNAQFYSKWWNEKKYADFGGVALERAVMMKKRAELNPF